MKKDKTYCIGKTQDGQNCVNEALYCYEHAERIAVAEFKAKYAALKVAAKDVLSLARELEDDDPFFFEKRDGDERCNALAALLDEGQPKEG